MKASIPLGLCIASGLAAAAPAQALELETSAQAVAALIGDDQTAGGGTGLALELGAPVPGCAGRRAPPLILRLRAGALVGAGVVWTLEAGAAYRARWRRWEPDIGAYVLTAGGALARAIDQKGKLAGNPVALELGLNPLRFRLEQGWVSLLSVRAGPTLLRSGHPPIAVYLTLAEVGRAF